MSEATEREPRKLYGIREIYQADERTLGVTWTDGIEDRFDVVELRRRCPCAVCVDEHSGERKLKDHDVSDAVRPQSIDNVGRYALRIAFSDGHNTGIYAFDRLRQMKESS